MVSLRGGWFSRISLITTICGSYEIFTFAVQCGTSYHPSDSFVWNGRLLALDMLLAVIALSNKPLCLNMAETYGNSIVLLCATGWLMHPYQTIHLQAGGYHSCQSTKRSFENHYFLGLFVSCGWMLCCWYGLFAKDLDEMKILMLQANGGIDGALLN